MFDSAAGRRLSKARGRCAARMIQAAAFVLFTSCIAQAASRYTITPIGPLPAGVTILNPIDVDDMGRVVGAASGVGHTRGFVADGGVVTLLDPLPGGSAWALGVNNLGEVVGNSDLGGIPKAAWWPAGDPQAMELDTSGGPGANVYATGINDASQVVGYYTSSGSGNVNSWTAVRWDRDEDLRYRETDLAGPVPAPPGVFTAAYSINSAGAAVGTGSSEEPGVLQAALRWSPTGVVQQLDALVGSSLPRYEAHAINDNQIAVGWGVSSGGASTPVKWAADGSAINLGQPTGFASTQPIDINDAGVIIARAAMAPPDNDRRPMANNGGVWMDLNQRLLNGAGWSLRTVSAINDLGQIVGLGELNGLPAGFLLTPAAPTLPGDFDFDGNVGRSDFLVWQQQFGAANSSPADANDDGLVDAADLAIWSANFGATSITAAAWPAPEPTALSLLIVALAGVRAFRPARRPFAT